ncbi:MAG: DMT family transporter [Paracoccaceae bacterium]
MSATHHRPLDTAGFWGMVALSFLFAINNVLIKLGNEGFHPVFYAALRSVIAFGALAVWMKWRGIRFHVDMWRPGLLLGLAFSAEFFFLFSALDTTSVVRASSLFYSMPIWMAIAAHFLFPGERLTPLRALGFILGFSSVVVTMVGRDAAGAHPGSLTGDIFALLGAASWASIVIISRKSRMGAMPAETQLVWQLAVSAVILSAIAPMMGAPMVRDLTTQATAIVVFQGVGIAAFAFVAWFWMIKRYHAASVAAFSFVTPVLSALLGWLWLGEAVGPATPIALGLLIAGLFLISRKPR